MIHREERVLLLSLPMAFVLRKTQWPKEEPLSSHVCQSPVWEGVMFIAAWLMVTCKICTIPQIVYSGTLEQNLSGLLKILDLINLLTQVYMCHPSLLLCLWIHVLLHAMCVKMPGRQEKVVTSLRPGMTGSWKPSDMGSSKWAQVLWEHRKLWASGSSFQPLLWLYLMKSWRLALLVQINVTT